ncbi:hypothetical protein DM806_22095 [Sphingobium lactosutens]|uniref:hypothetical protein n=1 Tax=Sphingobium lactosutens TaxID=522773 RepID=UPI0015C0AE72|nr:hypothetical protein [Sphingobium lactosutens]NWK98308.1 hypothetical protein [Sphingobium lactosutens]
MNHSAPIGELIATVTRALREDVLPQVESGWAAGNLRACIQVLTYLQDRSAMERDLLIADMMDMRGLLLTAAEQGLTLESDVLALFGDLPDRQEISTSQLRSENAACREAMTRLIREVPALGTETGRQQLRSQVHACIARMQEREYAMVQSSEAVPPI